MPTKQETIQVKFDTGANEWSMRKGGGPWQLPPNYPTLEVDENEVGLFTFEIVATNDATFAADAFSEKPGVNPPKADFPDQFLEFPMGPKKLIVVDTNEAKGGGHYSGGTYEYQLNFVGKKPLDPIITNNGCCQLFSNSELISYSLAAVSMLLLIMLVVRPWLARRAAGPPSSGPSGTGSSAADPKNGPGPR